MKTKNEILSLDNLIDNIQKNVEDSQLKPFKYMFVRNKLRFANIVNEKNKIGQTLQETIPREEGELEEHYFSRLSNSKEYQDFLKEEVEMEYFTIKASKLEGDEDFSLIAANSLMGVLILDDE